MLSSITSLSFSPELACPPHSHYELCGSSCPSSCAEPALPDSCPTPCQEGCQCDPGFMLSGTDCVPPTQCGCSLEGRYYLPGEIFWAGERCEQLCHCETSTGMVRCSPYSCGPGQRCGVLRGIFGCHTLSPGTCQAAGCLDISTQDGRPDEFSGTCPSGFAISEGNSGSLPFHKVELGKEENSSDYPAEIIPVTSFPMQGVHACLRREVSSCLPPGLFKLKRNTTLLLECHLCSPSGSAASPGPWTSVWL